MRGFGHAINPDDEFRKRVAATQNRGRVDVRSCGVTWAPKESTSTSTIHTSQDIEIVLKQVCTQFAKAAERFIAYTLAYRASLHFAIRKLSGGRAQTDQVHETDGCGIGF